jgi:hypothetical protein
VSLLRLLPFGTVGDRDLGAHRSVNVIIRSISVPSDELPGSYDYIKNLIYVEFDITT